MKWLKKLWNWLKANKTVENPVEKPIEVTKPKEETDVKSDKLLWVPWAVRPSRKMPTSWEYADGYPKGAIIHFTAGRDKTEADALGSYDWGCDQGYTFFVIGPTGVLYQGFPLNRGGSHAGSSSWPGLGSGVSSKLVGIEIACAGKLDSSNKSWFGVKYDADEVRNGFKKYTSEQEETLIKLLVWLKKNCPEVFDVQYILGHDEVSPGRKNDPGHSLSMGMDGLREKIKRLTFD